MTISFPGPMVWNVNNAAVIGFFEDSRPYHGEVPALAEDLRWGEQTGLYHLGLEEATPERLREMHHLVQRVLADGRARLASAKVPAGYGNYVAKLETLAELAELTLTAQPEPETVPPRRFVDAGRVLIDDAIDEGFGNGVYRAHLRGHPEKRRLVTVAPEHPRMYQELQAELAYPIIGIAPLESIGPITHTDPTWHGVYILEVMPAGEPTSSSPPLPERAVIDVGFGAATTVAAAHAAGLTLYGVRPELLYFERREDGAVFTGLVPRAQRFLDTARLGSRGIRALGMPYGGAEQAKGLPDLGPPSDIHALATTLFQLHTGKNPYGENTGEVATRMAMGAPDPWPGSPALGRLLQRAMATDPTLRPTAAQFLDALGKLA